jgi:transcriptional regulator with GAF, ATPase, and Fis domain
MTTASILSSSVGGILVASPSTLFREQVRRSLPQQGSPIQEVQGGADALASLESGQWDVLFLDRRLRDLDAEELVGIIKTRFPGIEVVLLDSGGDFSQLSGAFASPEPNGITHQLQVLAPSDADTKALPGMIGRAPAMQRLYRLTRLVAPRTTTVLVLGATGTGKELVARAIHQLSPRAARTCVVVNCAAIPEALLESELFGYVRGAFTGAVQTYAGRIYAAQGGTLFLDEIGELPIALQAKLLRFLEQKEVQRLGSSEAVKVDVRVVAATNADLPRQVERGAFREDLYYRLSAFPLELPPLSQREEDILPLAEHFLQSLNRAGEPVLRLSAEACRMLTSHAWKGNVRELQQVMERAAILADGRGTIISEDIYFAPLPGCDGHAGGYAAKKAS